MAKDPAALLYIDKWLVSTKGMRANAKGWYLNLILYQYDMGDLPKDIEELANLCDVRVSEFDVFKQVFEQVLKQKFKENEKGRLENDFAKEILQKREKFKDKRSSAGKMSYILKYFRKNFKVNKGLESFIKENIDLSIDTKNEQVLKQVFKQISELYINVNKDINKDKDKCERKKQKPEIPNFEEFKQYALEKESTINIKSLNHKYDAWVENGWKDGNGNKIDNWKTKLLNTLQYIKKDDNNQKTLNNDSDFE